MSAGDIPHSELLKDIPSCDTLEDMVATLTKAQRSIQVSPLCSCPHCKDNEFNPLIAFDKALQDRDAAILKRQRSQAPVLNQHPSRQTSFEDFLRQVNDAAGVANDHSTTLQVHRRAGAFSRPAAQRRRAAQGFSSRQQRSAPSLLPPHPSGPGPWQPNCPSPRPRPQPQVRFARDKDGYLIYLGQPPPNSPIASSSIPTPSHATTRTQSTPSSQPRTTTTTTTKRKTDTSFTGQMQMLQEAVRQKRLKQAMTLTAPATPSSTTRSTTT